MATQAEYDQLSLYTLAHRCKDFIHQHVADDGYEAWSYAEAIAK